MKSGSKPHYTCIEDVISRHNDLYGDLIDFSKSEYKNTSTLLLMTCKIHNKEFRNTTYHILRGAGCRECRKEKIHKSADKKRLGKEVFVERSQSIHSDRYDYSLVEYKSLTDCVEIICNDHGIFRQKPREHLRGHGCQQCAETTISIVGLEWLESLCIDMIDIEHRIGFGNRWYFVDGFDPITNTIYEFYGDYWHGNPKTTIQDDINPQAGKTFRQLYENTMVRENNIRSLGYNFVSIWEGDYNAKKVI